MPQFTDKVLQQLNLVGKYCPLDDHFAVRVPAGHKIGTFLSPSERCYN